MIIDIIFQMAIPLAIAFLLTTYFGLVGLFVAVPLVILSVMVGDRIHREHFA